MSSPWDRSHSPSSSHTNHSHPQLNHPGANGWIASPALQGTIVLAQCRSWLLAEEESRCRSLLNGLNHEKHAIKTSLNSKSETMQKECNTMKVQLTALRAKEEQLRKDLDASSTLYLKLFRDPTVNRANDEMLREKQRSNELWNQLEELIHERNELNMAFTKLESTNLCIIQNLYQTQVLLQTQQEKQRSHGLYGMDITDEGEEIEGEEDQANKAKKGRHSLPLSLPQSSSSSNLSSAASTSAATPSASSTSPETDPSSLEISAVSPLDPVVLEEVNKLNQLRNGEIVLQKRLSKFLGLREQVQTYLIKIAGFQKKLWQHQQQGSQKRTSSQPSSGRSSPSPSSGGLPPTSPRSSSTSNVPSILKKSASKENVSNSQPIPIIHQRRPSGSGANSVFNPFSSTPTDSSAASPTNSSSLSSNGSATNAPHQLLKPSSGSGVARSISPSPSTSTPNHSAPSSPATSNLQPAGRPASSRASSTTSSSSNGTNSRSAAQRSSGSHSTSTSANNPSTSLQAQAERAAIEHTQLANLVFDARNRKVLQRICEHFQRSGLLSSRRYKKSQLLIHNAFLGVELLTWVLNIGISNHRNDALILLELLLRAGLIDMIQETSTEKKPPSSTSTSIEDPYHAAPSPSSLRISDRTVFGDMKLQFALYRLRGDSSEIGKLSKSGWLHRVSRWRVTKKYVSWDADSHRFAIWNSNKDEHPSKVYYLGASTVIMNVEQHDSSPRFGSSSSSNTGSSSTFIDGSSSKFYFQLQFHPAQNDETSILLYASSARERNEWLKILWLSGCEYPSLTRGVVSSALSPSSNSAYPSDAKKEDVPPGSRPSPIHPSLLLNPGHNASALVTSPIGLENESSDESDEDEYYEDDLIAPVGPPSLVASTSTPSSSLAEDHDYMDGDDILPRSSPGTTNSRRYAPDEHSDSTGHTRASSLSVPSRPLPASASFSGGTNQRRRLSLAEKKHESDCMGVFSLKRAKSKFVIQAALARVQETKRKNLEKRKSLLEAKHKAKLAAESESHSKSSASSTTTNKDDSLKSPLPAIDGLELGWREFFVTPSDDATDVEPALETLPSSSSSSTNDLHSGDMKSPESSEAVTPDRGNSIVTNNADPRDSDDELAPHGDEDEDSDYNSADEQDELDGGLSGEGGELDLRELLHPSAPTPSSITLPENPTTADLEAMRLVIRKQRFQAISLSLTQILAPIAQIGAPSSNTSNSTGANQPHVHALTAFITTFVKQFHDLYGSALELDHVNTPSAITTTRASTHPSPPTFGWPIVHRAVSLDSISANTSSTSNDPSVRRARERLSEGGSPAPVTEGTSPWSAPVTSPPVSATPATTLATYPFPRHARSVLQAAKDDVRHFLQVFNTLLADVLKTCEDELREEVIREAARTQPKDSKAAKSGATTLKRNDPALRRIEREFLLLSRLCSQLVSHHLFQAIHRTLFPLYEYASLKKTAILLEAIEMNKELEFKEMGLSEELIFIADAPTPKNGTNGQEDATTGTTISYQHAIDTFRTLSTLSSPLDKLHCVVSVAKAICACVDQAKQAQLKQQQASKSNGAAADVSTSTQPAPVVIGADDLLLLFTYLLIHTSVPSLLAELSFLSDFIPEHQRCTMQGYYLATTQAASELLMSEQFQTTIQQREGNQLQSSTPATTAATQQLDDQPGSEPIPTASDSTTLPLDLDESKRSTESIANSSTESEIATSVA